MGVIKILNEDILKQYNQTDFSHSNCLILSVEECFQHRIVML